jgi:hypothetical protein
LHNIKTPNKACSGFAGFGAIYKQFSGFGLFLLSSNISARPQTTNANRWALTQIQTENFCVKSNLNFFGYICMWRLRTVIKSEVVIEIGDFTTSHVRFNVFAINKENTLNGEAIPPNMRYCDVLLFDNMTDILDAFAFLYNEINGFLDRVSLASYGWASIHDILSIAPDKVKPNEEFEIAFPQFSINRKTINLNLSNLKSKVELNFSQQRWARLLRLGLNASSEEEKFICYYSLLEEIAREESSEFIVNTCKNCNTQVNTGRKATNNFIKNLMKKHDMEFDLVDKAPEIRNKIAHGGADKNKAYFSYVAKINSHMEEICLIELESRLKIDVINRLHAHIIDIPMVKHHCICNMENSFDLIQSTQTLPARFVKLKHSSESMFQNQTAQVGMPLDKNGMPIINPFSWPEIVA